MVELPYLSNMITLPWDPSYPTFTDKVICGVSGKLSYLVGLLDVYRAALYCRERTTDGAGVARTSCNFQGIFLTPPAAPALVRRDSTVRRCSSVLPNKVRSIGTHLQHRMSCGRPTDQKLCAPYIRGVRVTACWGATWISP